MSSRSTGPHLPRDRLTTSPQLDSRPGIPWLVRLRWVAVAGQLIATLVGVTIVETELDLAWVLTCICVLAASNIGLYLTLRRPAAPTVPLAHRRPAPVIAATLTLDTALLTAILLASGGPMNPFSVFYIVEVALAGLLLGATGAWLMAGLTTLGFGLLFLLAPEDPHAHHNASSAHAVHLQGMWVAYALAASLVAMFVSGIAFALRRSERDAANLRERALEAERMASLAAFSAAAAHELGTPLSTIAVVATELASALESSPGSAQLVDDARLVRREVDRCRDLLRDLSERAGTWAGENPERLTLGQLVHDLREHLPLGAHTRLVVDGDLTAELVLPRRSLTQSLSNIVRNALDVSTTSVELVVRIEANRAQLTVRDRGPGFPPEALARLGEPFNSQRPGGLGLGLHLAHAFADKLGGTLAVRPREGGGSEVALEIPAKLTGYPS